MPSPARQASGTLHALRQHRGEDDPAVTAARAELAVVKVERYIEQVAAGVVLRPEHVERITAALHAKRNTTN